MGNCSDLFRFFIKTTPSNENYDQYRNVVFISWEENIDTTKHLLKQLRKILMIKIFSNY